VTPARELRLGAVVLAAGAGTRLGGVAKALLRGAGGDTFLASVLGTARRAGLAEAIVVVGPPFGEAVATHARSLGARVVENPLPARGMASSVALGFAAMAETSCDAAWLWPVDHPAVTEASLRALVGALGEHAAVRPVVDGRGGHPPLIARAAWPTLVACATREGGARAALAEVGMTDVALADPGCVRDIDTAADREVG
jgi:molybdenum cofactor cytidylyltransferase